MTTDLRHSLLRELAAYTVPRNVELAALLTLPVIILKVGTLTIGSMESALDKRGLSVNCGVNERSLRAALFAHAGSGIVLVDGCDSDAEQRFSVAHELGHFIVDYLEPRLRAITKLRQPVAEVLDGLRSPTVDERVYGLLADVDVRPQLHMMHRHSTLYTGFDEFRADRLAFELLAPLDEVWEAVCSVDETGRRHGAEAILLTRYEFPPRAARDYSEIVVSRPDHNSIRKAFGLDAKLAHRIEDSQS